LHIATHGYFLPDRPVEDVDVPLEDADRMGRRPALPPLLRSGLVLTGANRVTDPKAPAAVADEGWLTAEEVALMDLRGTELVVLSACESGLGDVAQAGEGVMGLRRAFQYAGAESVLVTLFKVSDVETRSLMKFFYQRLKDGATPADALHDAKVDLIARRRKEHKAAHPFFWSSFVLVGSKG
jgi:CHAT domain-containing protein